MKIVTRAEYEGRAEEFAWLLITKVPLFLIVGLAIGLANFAHLTGKAIPGANVFVGMALALAMPFLVGGLGIISGAINEVGKPTRAVALVGQFAMLSGVWIAVAARNDDRPELQ